MNVLKEGQKWQHKTELAFDGKPIRFEVLHFNDYVVFVDMYGMSCYAKTTIDSIINDSSWELVNSITKEECERLINELSI